MYSDRFIDFKTQFSYTHLVQAQIAQLVEQRIRNAVVAGSTPVLGN